MEEKYGYISLKEKKNRRKEGDEEVERCANSQLAPRQARARPWSLMSTVAELRLVGLFRCIYINTRYDVIYFKIQNNVSYFSAGK